MNGLLTADELYKIYDNANAGNLVLSEDLKNIYSKLKSSSLPRRDKSIDREDALNVVMSDSQREFLDDLHMEQMEQM